VCEQFIAGKDSQPPPDYKFFCFHGEPRFIQVDYARFVRHTRNMFDLNWSPIPCAFEYPCEQEINSTPPPGLPKMLSICKLLAAPFPFVRVDLYCTDEKIWFGELTFYPEKGVGRFKPYSYDKYFGGFLDLAKCVMA
jgi:hypothetical protein